MSNVINFNKEQHYESKEYLNSIDSYNIINPAGNMSNQPSNSPESMSIQSKQ